MSHFSPSQQAQIQYLTGLGFPSDLAIDALFRTHGNVEQARQLLSAMFSPSTLDMSPWQQQQQHPQYHPQQQQHHQQHQHHQQQQQQQQQQESFAWHSTQHGTGQYQSGAAIQNAYSDLHLQSPAAAALVGHSTIYSEELLLQPAPLPSRTDDDYSSIPPNAILQRPPTAAAPLSYVELPAERTAAMDRPLPAPTAVAAVSPFRRSSPALPPAFAPGSPAAARRAPPAPAATRLSGVAAAPMPAPAPLPAPAPQKPALCELCTSAPPIAKIQLPNDARDRWLCQNCVLRSVSGAAAASQPPKPGADGYQAMPLDSSTAGAQNPSLPMPVSFPSPTSTLFVPFKVAANPPPVSLPGVPTRGGPPPGRAMMPPPPARVTPPPPSPVDAQLERSLSGRRTGSPSEASPSLHEQRSLSARQVGGPPRAMSPSVLRGGSIDSNSLGSASTGRSDEGNAALLLLEAEFECFSPSYVAEVLIECRGNPEVAHQLLEAEREQQRLVNEDTGILVTYDVGANSDDDGSDDDGAPRYMPTMAAASVDFSDGVEDLAPYAWYHGAMRAIDCEKLMRGKPIGTFLVRNSSRSQNFVVVWNSVDKSSGGVKIVHILVQAVDGGFAVDGTNVAPRRRLAEIIDHYSRHLRAVAPQMREPGCFDEALAAHRAKNRIALKAYVPRDPPSSSLGKAAAAVAAAPAPLSTTPVFSGGEQQARAGDAAYYDGPLNLGQFPWFHGKLSAAEAESLLDGRSKGSFLVRLSAKSDKYVIVWMSDNKQKVHILVDSVDNGDPTQRFKVDTKHSAIFFSNLPAVIQEYLKKKHLTAAVPCTPDLTVFDPALRRHKEQTAK